MSGFASAALREPDNEQVTHGYLEGPRPLFASYHRPVHQAARIGFVLCPPLGWEAIQSYQSIRILAKELAGQGFPVLRLNYDGTGESPGSDLDPDRVGAWIESIRRAVVAMSNSGNVDSVGLVGLRMGATLAACAAAKIETSCLILWEPVLAGAQYTRELEILATAALARVPGAGTGSPQLKGIEAGGHFLTPETVLALNSLNLEKVQPCGTPAVLIVNRDDRPTPSSLRLQASLAKQGCSVTIEKLPGFREMMTYPEKSRPATAAIARICAWAAERWRSLEVGKEPLATGFVLSESVIRGAVFRRPVRFGPQSRIFGVISEPADRRLLAPTPAVLLLTGGLVPRTAVNGMYKELAIRLAERGHSVLRMDVSGIGESTSPIGAATENAHPPWLVEDVMCAATNLLSEARSNRLWVVGLCSGAYAAFQMSLSESRVAGAILINPADLQLSLSSSEPSRAQQALETVRYWQSMRSIGSWAKLLKGQVSIEGARIYFMARVRASLAMFRHRLASRISRVPVGLAGEIHSLVTRGTRISVLFSDGDIGQQVLHSQIGGELDFLNKAGFTQAVFSGADHTFNQFTARENLLTWIIDEIAGPTIKHG